MKRTAPLLASKKTIPEESVNNVTKREQVNNNHYLFTFQESLRKIICFFPAAQNSLHDLKEIVSCKKTVMGNPRFPQPPEHMQEDKSVAFFFTFYLQSFPSKEQLNRAKDLKPI